MPAAWWPGPAPPIPVRPSIHPLLVELALVGDRLLDLLGVADVAEHLTPELARRADDEVPGADQPLEHALVEPHVVDRLQRDLHRALGDPALAVDDAVGRHDEVRRRPRDELPDGERDQEEDPIADAPQTTMLRLVPSSGAYVSARIHPATTRIVTMAGTTIAIQCGRSSRTSSFSIRSRRGTAWAESYSSRSTSPNRTTCSPVGVRTTSPPRSSTSTASPSTTAPAMVARTPAPSVAHTSR